MPDAEGLRLATQAKQAFARLNLEEQKALDEAESRVIEEYARKKFVEVAKVPADCRDAQQREYYDQWSFKFADDGSPAPTIVIPSQAEIARLESAELKSRSAEVANRRGPGQRLRG